MPRRATRIPATRPSLPQASEETRLFSDYLLSELLAWPQVSSRLMFGLNAVYRGKEIFGALPRTRALETSCSVSFKLHAKSPRTLKLLESDQRVVTSELKMANWFSFEVRSDRDLSDAIEWFARAYRQAANPSPRKRK